MSLGLVDFSKPPTGSCTGGLGPYLETAGSRKTHPLGYIMKAIFTCEDSTRALSAAASTVRVRFLTVEKVCRDPPTLLDLVPPHTHTPWFSSMGN